jgi:hypothetical protein
MAQINHIFRGRTLFNSGRRDVDITWTGCSFHTTWLGNSGDRVSMGQKVALNGSPMAARSFSKTLIQTAN